MNKQRRRSNRKGVSVTRQRWARRNRHVSRRLRAERLEDRRLLTGAVGGEAFNAFHNYIVPEDVNGDFYLSPRDALSVISDLNNGGSRTLAQDGTEVTNGKVDTNGDGVLSPRDALTVIGALNDAEGNGNGVIKVVGLTLEVQDADGNPLPDGRVRSGEDFRLQMSVQDLRDGGTGVFAAYMDMAYSSQLDVGGTLTDLVPDYSSGPDLLTELFTIGGTDPSAFVDADGDPAGRPDGFDDVWVKTETYENGDPVGHPWRWFDSSAGTIEDVDGDLKPDELDEVGAILDFGLTSDNLGNAIYPMLYATLTADLQFDYPGLLTFQGEKADLDPSSEILFLNDPGAGDVPADAIDFNTATVEIYKPVYARDVSEEVLEDTSVTITLDAALDRLSTGSLALQGFTQPANGSVELDGGQLVYTPDVDYNNDSLTPDTFTYTMTDGLGNTDSATVSVTVTAVNDDPIANPDSETVDEDPAVPYTFDVLANDAPGPETAEDEVDQELTLVSVGTSGQTLEGGTVSIDGNTVRYTPPANFPIGQPSGVDTFTYTVQDDEGGTDVGTVTVTVVNTNDAPIAVDDSFGEDPQILEDLAGESFVELDVLQNDETGVDPVAETATFTVIEVGGALNGTGDGIVDVGLTQNGGQVSIAGSVVRYTPADDFFGTDTFVYQMSDRDDGTGLTDFATVTVQVTSVNDPPTAQDAFLEADEREDGDPPTELDVLTGLTTPGPDNEATELGDEVFVNAILSGPSEGTLEILPGGKLLSYTPEVGFEGTDVFTYTVVDSFGAVSNVATATIEVEPLTLPRARDDRNVAVVEDTPTEIEVLSNDELNVDATLSEFIIVQQPEHGTATVTAGNTILYTPDGDYFGPDVLVYQIDDTGDDSIPDTATVTINVTPVNDLPVANDDDFEFDEDETQTLSVLGNDTTGADNEIEDIFIHDIVDGPDFGTLAVIDGGTRFQYVPDANFYGTDTFTYLISDEQGGISVEPATVTLTVNNTNDDPTASDKSFTVLEDSDGSDAANQFDVTDGDLPGAPGPYSDDDGDSITLVNVGSVDGDGVFQEGVTNNGGAVAIVGGIVQYTPVTHDFGTDSFSYTIEDEFGARDSAAITVTITEVNDPPTVEDELLMALKDFENQELDVLANDSVTPDEGTGEVLTIKELVGQGPDGVLDTAHGSARVSDDGLKVIYTPDPGFETVGGDFDSFNYIVQDGRGGETEGQAQIDVIDAVPSDISGVVYVDANADGIQQPNELTLAGVEVTLSGVNIRGAMVDMTVQTDGQGVFMFPGILPSAEDSTQGYSITAQTPEYMNDGLESIIDSTADEDYNPGLAQNDLFSGIQLGVWGAGDRSAQNYAFGESGLASGFIKLTQYLASHRNGLMLATDGDGDTFWFSMVEGWEGVESVQFTFDSIPAANSSDNSGLAGATLTVNGQTRRLSYFTHYDFAGDPRDGGVVVFLKGSAADFGFQLASGGADASGEGEMAGEADELEMLAAGDAGQYQQGVDAVFGSGDWA